MARIISAVRHGFVELSTLNIALLGRQPKLCKNPFLPFIFSFSFSFFVLSFILLILGILVLFYLLYCFVLFDVFIKCFRFTQEDRVRVYLFETEFLG